MPEIRQLNPRLNGEGRYCLNDIHKAAGGENRHRPQFWLDVTSTQELLNALEKDGIPAFYTKCGRTGVTFGILKVVYAYASWIQSNLQHLGSGCFRTSGDPWFCGG
ncbi:hypothetical protein LIMNO130_50003 [Limnobacter sp. 130]|uniref:KilA-N domain-containing protein n=1 Tax=Limnobacter sp. 130 TaxID=2653147 RepID=UPI0012F04FA6|nr:KilA-N domain-containing protein [Limnobacter sp. 130]VWX35554.1 hypothetical protein LIMNO130_50003 [Limnobacter sp. 130]